MDERIYNALQRMLRALDDPRARVYVILLEALRPVSRGDLLKLARLHPSAVDRALRFLHTGRLVGRIRAGKEVYFYAII